MTRNCPGCGRPNGIKRATCMYCGSDLQVVEGDEESTEQSLPPDLDELFRQAMVRGDVGALQAALADHQHVRTQAEPAPTREMPQPVPAGKTETTLEEPPTAAPPVDVAASIAALIEGAHAATAAWNEGDHAAVRQWIDGTQALLQALGEALPEPVVQAVEPVDRQPAFVGPTITLPKVRQPAALVVDGMGDEQGAMGLADCLGIDGATARLLAVSRYPRVALRSADMVRMKVRADRIRTELGVRAAAFEPEDLLAMGPAVGVVRVADVEPILLEIVDVDRWDGPDKALPVRGAVRESTVEPILLVAGEVVVQHYRAARGGGRLKHLRENRVRDVGEQRIAVLDIYDGTDLYRITQGHTALDGFSGYQASSFRRSLRSLTEAIVAQTGAWLIAPRVCQPGLGVSGGGGGDGGRGQDTGWPAWEEHSRTCRMLLG